MGIVVAKFGGTSLADHIQFKKVKEIVLSDERRKIVVPSAPGKRFSDDTKVTDLLYEFHVKASEGLSTEKIYNQLIDRFVGIVKDLSLSTDIIPYIEKIKSDIENGASADYAASRGEYLSGILLAEFLGYDFIDPSEIIVFDSNGRFDDEATQTMISKRLKEHKRAIIPGFYGAMPNGDIKTFSRGGSDITGALIARGVKADIYENWTDVSGFLMADPRIVENPKLIEKVTYRELRELSYMGASVLHEDAIYPCAKVGIPINIKNTNEPNESGTIIVQDAEPVTYTGGITGIAGKKDFTVIAMEKTFMNMEVGFGRRLLTILEENGISFEHMPSGIDTISLVIANSQLNGKLDEVVAEIEMQLKPDKIEVFTDMALIATVGQGMAYTPGMASRLFSALAGDDVNVRMIDQGPSEINILIGVESKDFENAVKSIYKAFVNCVKSHKKEALSNEMHTCNIRRDG